MKGLARKVTNIVSKEDGKKYSLLFLQFWNLLHSYTSAYTTERCAVQNSKKTELTSDSFLLPLSPKEDLLTIPFLKEGTFICKCLAGSSDTKCSMNHKVITAQHRSSNSDLCGSLICL